MPRRQSCGEQNKNNDLFWLDGIWLGVQAKGATLDKEDEDVDEWFNR